MTELLNKAIQAMQSLPEEKQNQIAQLVLQEIEDDARWETTTNRHPDVVSKIVTNVLDADRRGETEPLDPDRL